MSHGLKVCVPPNYRLKASLARSVTVCGGGTSKEVIKIK